MNNYTFVKLAFIELAFMELVGVSLFEIISNIVNNGEYLLEKYNGGS